MSARALQADAHQHVRAHAEPRAAGAPAGWRARSSSRVASAVRRSYATADGVRACAPPAPRTAGAGSGSRGQSRARCRSTRAAALAARPARSSGSSQTGRSGSRERRSQQRRRCAGQPRDGRRVEQVGVVLEPAGQPSGRRRRRAASRSNFGRAVLDARSGSSAQPGQRRSPARACSGGRTSPGRAGCGSGRAPACSSSTSRSNGSSWCA